MINWALVILWILSAIPVFLVPLSIALFYRRIFHKDTYPYLFLLALFLYSASVITLNLPSFEPADDLFLTIGGIVLIGGSLRLHQVMMGRER